MGRDGISTWLSPCGEGFIGCPRDAEPFAEVLLKIWADLPVPGLRPRLTFWRHDADLHSRTSAQPSQFHIARTSDPATNPVFILLAQSIGTPVRPPADVEGWRHWQALRAWLDSNGFGMVAMVGDPGFTNPAEPPKGRVPLSGTLFELFDAMRTDPDHADPSCRGPRTFLRVFDLSSLVPPTAYGGDNETQKEWCTRLLGELSRSYTVLPPATLQDFERLSRESLKYAFGLPPLNPWGDPLPGLEAVEETVPLLFGRDRLIRVATDEMFDERPPLTLVEGVSGVGKSSFLRGGLMRTWFGSSPPGAGRRHGCRALLAEPALLQLQPDEDPLATLGNLLAVDPETVQPRERIIGPLPTRLSAVAPPLPTACGDKAVDLRAAIAWWAALTQGAVAPLILILDQAEQVEAIARRGVDEDADPVLSPAWWRFTALLGALTGRLAAEWLTPEVTESVRELTERMPVHLILGLHRRSTLALWPLRAGGPEPHRLRVEPISERQDWQELIERTCQAYGLEIDASLRDAMTDEAHRLVHEGQILAASTRAAMGIEPAQSSILPLIKVALQHLIGGWAASHAPDDPDVTSDRRLDAARYGGLAGVQGSIDALGERLGGIGRTALPGTAASTRAGISSALNCPHGRPVTSAR